jgi:MAM domain.
MCGWTQSKSDDFDWAIGSANTPSVRTGPKADHTLNTSSGKINTFSVFLFLKI